MIDVTVDNTEVELISDVMWSLGVVAIEELKATSSQTTLRTSMGDDPSHFVDVLQQQFPQVHVSRVSIDRDVADTWREFATATMVNNSVALVPAWQPAPEGTIAIFIEPLDTFGMGNHPTTVLALRLALQHISAGSTVFDLGSGSGVLSVSLAALANCQCFAYDIADSAQDALQTNMNLNQVTTCSWVDGYPPRLVDAVLANILAPVLKEESDSITNCVTTGGVVVLSGMRDDQVDDVLTHYECFTEQERVSQDGWTAVALVKHETMR